MMIPRPQQDCAVSSGSSSAGSSAGSLSQSPLMGSIQAASACRPCADPSELDIDALIASVTTAPPSYQNNDRDLLNFVDELVDEEDRLRKERYVQDRLNARKELINSIAAAKASRAAPKTFDWGMLYRDEKDTGGPLVEVTPYKPTPGFDFSNNVDWAELFFNEKYAPYEAKNDESEIMEKIRQKSQAEDAVADMKLKMAWCGNGDSSVSVPSRLSVGLRVPISPQASRPQTSRSFSERTIPSASRLPASHPSWPQSKSAMLAPGCRPVTKSPSPSVRQSTNLSPPLAVTPKPGSKPRWPLSKSLPTTAPRFQPKSAQPTAPSSRPNMNAFAARSEPARRSAPASKNRSAARKAPAWRSASDSTSRKTSGRFTNMFENSTSKRGPARKPKMVWQTYTAAEYFK